MPTDSVSRSTPGLNSYSGVRNSGAGLVPVIQSSPRISDTFALSRVSSRTAGFHDPRRVGKLKPLPFTFTENYDRYAYGYWRTYDTSIKPTQAGYSAGTWTGNESSHRAPNNYVLRLGYDSAQAQTCIDIATNKLRGKIKNTSANLAVAYAEAGKTATMVGDTAIKIARAMQFLKKGNFGAAAGQLGVGTRKRAESRFTRGYAQDAGKAVASGWLALNYGWKPLLDDVYGACEDLARNNLNDMIVTSSAGHKLEFPINGTETSFNGKAKSFYWGIGQAKYQVRISCSYKRPGNSSLVKLKETGITNPLLIAWELVPYSFVVDWFLPIGNWLDTFDATLGLTFHSGYRTVYFKSTAQMGWTYNGVDNYGVMQDARYQCSLYRVKVDRVVLADFPNPTLPRFKNPMSISHMASGIALLSQIFRK
jgi:hypothetical protein